MNRTTVAVAALACALSVGAPAQAGTFIFNFGGSGVSGHVHLTYAPNPNTGVLPGTSPNPVDPIGSFVVTGASGTFADSNIGLNTTITGIVAANPSSPEPTNLLAPHSFGWYNITNGVDHGGGVIVPGFSYDNLLYPGGSPQTASDYPFHGGFLDIYGLVFTTSSGKAFDFWSNGVTPGGLNYGAGVTDGTNALDYANGLSVSAVPEPATWALSIAGFALMGAAMRKRRTSLRVRFA